MGTTPENIDDLEPNNLTSVIERFSQQPREILLAETLIYTSDKIDDLCLRRSAAAAMGYSRGGLYLDAARSLLRQIEADTHEISWRKEAYDAFLPILETRYRFNKKISKKLGVDLKHVISLNEGANYLSKDAELLWHLYSVCLNRSRHFMFNSVQWIDPTFAFTADEQVVVETIRLFRNHLEHRDNAIRTLTGADWDSFAESDQERLILGYRKNAKNEITFFPSEKSYNGGELTMPINENGFAIFAGIVQRIHGHIEDASLNRLETYFLHHPDEMPPLADIGRLITDELMPPKDNEPSI